MSMDLCYDLAMQELSDLDAHVAELIQEAEMVTTSADPDSNAVALGA
jgi:hypothetical protein